MLAVVTANAAAFLRPRPLLSRHMRALAATVPSLERAESVNAAQLITEHPMNNISPAIVERVGRSLHRTPNHPLNIIKKRIEGYFVERAKKDGVEFEVFDDLAPVVKITQNFDDLLIPEVRPTP
eukprot:scaffold172_cov254-Pinguiococcus_pyrenoidosus.AAC.21